MWVGTVVRTSWEGAYTVLSSVAIELADIGNSAAFQPLTGKFYVNFDSKVNRRITIVSFFTKEIG